MITQKLYVVHSGLNGFSEEGTQQNWSQSEQAIQSLSGVQTWEHTVDIATDHYSRIWTKDLGMTERFRNHWTCAVNVVANFYLLYTN